MSGEEALCRSMIIIIDALPAQEEMITLSAMAQPRAGAMSAAGVMRSANGRRAKPRYEAECRLLRGMVVGAAVIR